MTVWKYYWIHEFFVDSRYEIIFFWFHKKMWKSDFQQNEDKTCVWSIFQMLIFLRVCAVIFELDEVSMSHFVKFEFLSMTLKIEREFEKQRQFWV